MIDDETLQVIEDGIDRSVEEGYLMAAKTARDLADRMERGQVAMASGPVALRLLALVIEGGC